MLELFLLKLWFSKNLGIRDVIYADPYIFKILVPHSCSSVLQTLLVTSSHNSFCTHNTKEVGTSEPYNSYCLAHTDVWIAAIGIAKEFKISAMCLLFLVETYPAATIFGHAAGRYVVLMTIQRK